MTARTRKVDFHSWAFSPSATSSYGCFCRHSKLFEGSDSVESCGKSGRRLRLRPVAGRVYPATQLRDPAIVAAATARGPLSF
eukprot:5470245-Pleurochrysis_carterae.AAC.1